MSQQYLEAVRREDQGVNPLFAFLKARLTRVADGEAEIVMPVGTYLRQGGGVVAGGIMATLADEAMAHAVLSRLSSDRGTVTAEMNIRYLRSADPADGGELRAQAKVVKDGHSLCVAEARVLDGKGRLLATAGATFFLMAARREE